MRKIILFTELFVALLSFSNFTHAYVEAYAKLYRKSTDTIVDLVYDRHRPNPKTTPGELLVIGPKYAAEKLFPTEKLFLSYIRKWEKEGSQCDLVWETGGCDQWFAHIWCLLAMDSFFKLHKLKHIRFIPADRHRECGFVSLFSVYISVYNNKIQVYPQNLTGCSFENPAPLSEETAREIERVSGTATWKEYKKLRKRVIKKLKEYFGPWYREKTALDFEKDFLQNSFYCALCDIELLAHILSSKTPRIVVYAGAAHCSNILGFLEHNGFEVLYGRKTSPPDQELPLSALAPLEHRELHAIQNTPSNLLMHVYAYLAHKIRSILS